MRRSRRAPRVQRIRHVVFAGGGNRCFWQAGFWNVAAPRIGLAPEHIVAVSAGSAIACTLFAGTFDDAFAGYKRSIQNNQRNLYWRNVWRSDPIFPHGSLYRDAILGGMDTPALRRLRQGPQIEVLLSVPPPWASPALTIALGALAAGWDAWGRDAVHYSAGARVGFAPKYVSVQSCATPAEVADLIIASSCVPPLTPRKGIAGVVPLDGGLVSNAPVDCFKDSAGETLILLTRPVAPLPQVPGRIYAQPSIPVPVGAWDYTNVHAIQAAYDLGRRDADHFCQTVAC